ncbi:MAG: insulinase family protein, partial [Phycisphaerales bacterium]|nr:insulinase family protein [Phycisphaerales bacterium]
MLHGKSSALAGAFVVGFVATAACGQDVKYEKYKLDNGMTVILHEDHTLPVGAINLWYRVGSKDEPPQRSGFAHLFEHLMFMGTERVAGNKFDTIMESGGGSNNASTSSDRTNYFSSGPAALLPTLLWLDADRLEDLARTMDQEKLDKQRDVVRNERRQSYENRPYGKAELQIQEMMFPPGHPYHIPVIGTHEDLEAATVADVKDFFASFYVPNNVTLCVAGDFDPKVSKPLIADVFGSLPRRPDPKRSASGPVKLDGVKRATTYDKVQLPLVAMAYHSPAWYAEGDAEMNLAGAILSRGKTSRLYKRLVYDDKIAAEVSAYQDSGQLGSTFRIDVLAKPQADLDVLEKTVDEEVARLIKDGPQPRELEQRKAEYELRMLSGLQSVEAKADQFNEYDYIWGEPNAFRRDLDRYRNATVEGVRTWTEKSLTPGARVIMRVLPESADSSAKPEAQAAASAKDEKPKEAPPDAEKKAPTAKAEASPRPASARDNQPPPGVSPKFSPPAPESFTLSNGIPVMLWHKSELPLVAMTIVFM